MSLQSALITKLKSDAGVTAVIASRIYPEYVRQLDRVYPLAVYKIENTSAMLATDGPTGFMSADIVIAAIGRTYADADRAAGVIQASLDGTLGAAWGTTIAMQGCFLKDDGIVDNVITEQESEEILFYAKELTFEARYANS